MQFKTLLPPVAVHSTGSRRSPRLVDTDPVRVQVESTRFSDDDDRAVLQIRVWMYGKWGVFGLDSSGVLLCTARAKTERLALSRWDEQMELFDFDRFGNPCTMLPARSAHGGPRRSSLLLDADEPEQASHQVSAKVVTLSEDEEKLLQIRIWIAGTGWTQLVLTDRLGVAAFTAASSEKDAWRAALAALRGRGFAV